MSVRVSETLMYFQGFLSHILPPRALPPSQGPLLPRVDEEMDSTAESHLEYMKCLPAVGHYLKGVDV